MMICTCASGAPIASGLLTSNFQLVMKAPRSTYVCQACGSQSQKWLGRCPDCGGWNTLVEESFAEPAALPRGTVPALGGGGVRLYADVDTVVSERHSTGISEFDRVLGGGI